MMRDIHEPLWIRLREQRASPERILNELNITMPRIDVVSIARDLGIQVQFVSNPGWSGAVHGTDDGAKIWVANDESSVRQRFTIAHEIGHLMLHELKMAHRDVTFSGDKSEFEANDFAARLLMPADMVGPASERLKIPELASLFDVSEVAMNMRLRRLLGSR